MSQEIATLAGGCFWGVEELLRKMPGVIETQVGYAGGSAETATYEHVKKGNTGHAEAVQIVFDPAKLSFADLLRFFFKMHDPTTLNRQGNDRGTQYRSTIFYHSEEQKKTALEIIKEVDASKKWNAPIATTVVPEVPFYTAEEYHQKYLQKNPGGYNCHYVRD